MRESARYFLRVSTEPNIGHSDVKAIGLTYMALRHDTEMVSKDSRTVWKRVQEALKDAGLPGTQKQAANIIGSKQGSISEWNQIDRYPKIRHAIKIARATNTCVEWIYTGEGPKHPGPPEELAAQQLWDLWGRLPDVIKGKILGIAESNAMDVAKRSPGGSDPLHPGPGR